MHYCLLMHYQEGQEIGLTEEDMAAGRAAFDRYAADLDEAGVLVGTHVLQSASATTTYSAQTGTPEIQDGPFADTREKLGGVFVLDVPDLDAALAWARRCPAAQWGSVEVRPVAVTYRSGQGWYTP
ncbi:YciI family protein [Mycobacterium sp. LTG2003]